MKYFVSLCLLLPHWIFAQERQVCFTIDDLPVVSYGINEDAYLQEITADLIATFDAYQIPAIGFVNENKLYKNEQPDPAKVKLLEMWLEKGYELGNHTFSHPNYHRVGYKSFTEDILKGEKISRPLLEKYAQQMTYFRHPFLRLGATKGAHDSLTFFLRKHGYTEAPVTIDNEDYLFAKAYHVVRQQEDQAMMQKIGKEYIAYMENKLAYFESTSDSLFGRNIRHILLLHANKLNADYLDELAEMYQQRGYQFISLAEALEDEAYQHPITRYGDWGISWLDRWALSQGKKGAFFANDPPSPDYIQKLAQ